MYITILYYYISTYYFLFLPFHIQLQITKVCNFSATSGLDCIEQILYTYEALRTINLPSSQQYCSERVNTLFCDALMECSNESYVKDIVCQQVHQEYCTAEWRMLEMDNQTDGLINCEEYEETAPLDCDDQIFALRWSIFAGPRCHIAIICIAVATTTHLTILYNTW